MSPHRVLVLGAASWNRMIYVTDLPQGASATIPMAREAESVGSTGVGKAMALAALGCQPVLHCALGNDQEADRIVSACEARGITMLVETQTTPTPRHLNIMDAHGGRYSIFLANEPDDPRIDEARIRREIDIADTIFLSLSASSRKILPLLATVRAEVLLDLHDYDGVNPWYDPFIARADVLQLSDIALPDPDPVIRRLLAGRATQVVLTKAERGADIITSRDTAQIPSCPARIIDSNGAGDAFSVGLWHAQRAGLDLEGAGRFAAAMAACAVESADLFPTDITPDDIRRRGGLD